MTKNLLIVFIKNPILGKVKTRLAKTIGDTAALKLYKELVNHTIHVANKTKADVMYYFSNEIDTQWNTQNNAVQNGNDLGQRMQHAFLEGFKNGYQKIILIGSDLPELEPAHIENGFKKLHTTNVVFGPAQDGGYYLIGMKKTHDFLFKNKAWSTSTLLKISLQELDTKNISYALLKKENDIDTFEDLKQSSFYNNQIYFINK